MYAAVQKRKSRDVNLNERVFQYVTAVIGVAVNLRAVLRPVREASRPYWSLSSSGGSRLAADAIVSSDTKFDVTCLVSCALVCANDELAQELVAETVKVVTVKLGRLLALEVGFCGQD